MLNNEHIAQLSRMLIARYEGSKRSDGSAPPTGKMSVRLSDDDAYMADAGFKYRFGINDAAKELEGSALVNIKWYDRDNIIDRITFSIELIDRFYELANATRKVDILSEIIVDLSKCKSSVKSEWIIRFIDDMLTRLEQSKIPALIRDNEKRALIIRSLLGLDELAVTEDILLERVFSKKYLKNSKIFEKEARSSILSILKKYNQKIDAILSDDEILMEVGIEKTTTELFIKGPLRLVCGGKVLDLSNFPYGTALNTQTLRRIEVLDIAACKVISIENKANYLVACDKAKEDEIIIFSSGYYNPSQRKFLRALGDYLSESHPSPLFYHSGDLDVWGMNIFINIKEKVFPCLQPLDMDEHIFLQYIEFAEDITESHKEKLEAALSNDRFLMFHEVILTMIEHNKMLEQEAFIFDVCVYNAN